MKKVFIACFCAILMLMVPITSVASTPDISKLENIYKTAIDTPEIYLTRNQLKQINDFIDDNFEGEDKVKAEGIRDYIIDTNTLKVDIAKLADALVDHGYKPIPQEELDLVQTKEQLEQLIELFWVLDLFGGLVLLITSIVANRLGWLYTLINDGYDLFSEAIQLTIRILDESIDVVLDFVNAVNLMLTIPQVFSDMMEKLFNQEFNQFLTIVGNFINNFVADFLTLILSLIDVFVFIPEIWNFLKYDIVPFIEWILGAHWKDNIRVHGIIFENFLPLKNANVTCRGLTTKTDNWGVFDFKVDVIPSEDSFPPNEYYGLHNCKISVEKEGKILTETSGIISYVFSGGGITWPIFIKNPRSKSVGIRNMFLERFYNFFVRLYSLIPNFFKNYNRIDILLG
jgi:hypothetical protein